MYILEISCNMCLTNPSQSGPWPEDMSMYHSMYFVLDNHTLHLQLYVFNAMFGGQQHSGDPHYVTIAMYLSLKARHAYHITSGASCSDVYM